MTWLEKDIEDLRALQEEFCAGHTCDECLFGRNKNMECLEEVTNSIAYTYQKLQYEKRRLDIYV